MAGIKHLQGISYKQDGPTRAVADRFPERFTLNSGGHSSNHNAANHSPHMSTDHHPHNSMSKTSGKNISQQKLMKNNADNNHSHNSRPQFMNEQEQTHQQSSHTRNLTENRQDKKTLRENSSA